MAKKSTAPVKDKAPKEVDTPKDERAEETIACVEPTPLEDTIAAAQETARINKGQ